MTTDGLLLVDKPPGVTSHDVVDMARRRLQTRRIGHAGTLDPFATGLLVLLVGHATRLLAYLPGEPKVYEASVVFGAETDTDDVTGTVTREAAAPTEAGVLQALPRLTGTFEQIPPAYSAKQVAGRRAYAAARRGETLPLEAATVNVHRWDVVSFEGSTLRAVITCSGGTYIRALARDLGRACDSAAHLGALRRTRSGPFDVADAIGVAALRSGDVRLRPALDAIRHLPTVHLRPTDVVDVRHGRVVPEAHHASGSGTLDTAALIDDDDRLVAVAERTDGVWQPRVVMPGA